MATSKKISTSVHRKCIKYKQKRHFNTSNRIHRYKDVLHAHRLHIKSVIQFDKINNSNILERFLYYRLSYEISII